MIKVKNLVKYFLNNKRIMYLLMISILLVFCLILNTTFSLFKVSNNIEGTHIKIGEMSYIFNINSEYDDLKSNIYNDRVVKIDAKSTKIYYINLTAENKYNTKYQLIYNYCLNYNVDSNQCEYGDVVPGGVAFYYSDDTNDLTGGIIAPNGIKNIKLVVENHSNESYYFELGMLAGYTHNELKIDSNKGHVIVDSFEIPSADQVFELITYVDGVEVKTGTFPSTGLYTSYMSCEYPDGSVHDDVAIVRWNGSKWLATITNVPNSTVCSANFITNNNPYPIFTYTCTNGADCTKDTSKIKMIEEGVDGDWKIYFYESGTFKLTYPSVNVADVFVVGGGGGGARGDRYYGGGGGGGGYTKTVANVTIKSNTNYTITIGSGGAGGGSAGSNGNSTTAFSQTIGGGIGGKDPWSGSSGGAGGSGGGNGTGGGTSVNPGGYDGSNAIRGGSGQGYTTREFGITTATLYSGGGGGGAGTASGNTVSQGAGGAGGGGAGGGRAGRGVSGTKNTGGGGGGGGGNGAEQTGGGGAGGAGGSGIAVIRNARS